MGLIIWCSFNMLVGWLSGFAGIIINSEYDKIKIVWLNIFGIFLAFISLGCAFMVKTSDNKVPQIMEEKLLQNDVENTRD